MIDTYLAPACASEAIYREKMSRFLAFLVPVNTPEEAKEQIKDYQNRYHDARHVCWAYMIGPNRTTWQLNDNGEPSGTAGKPILGQINSAGLTDILIVVVRYFGGIKLGTSGLISAYRQAARMAIESTTIEEKVQQIQLRLIFPYANQGDVMKIVKDMALCVIDRKFDNTCWMTLSVRMGQADEARMRLSNVASIE